MKLMFVLFSKTQSKTNPTVESINKLFYKYRDKNIDGFISIGGGSVIDTCKVLNLCITNSVDCTTLLLNGYQKFKKCPHISIPTTCGTRSETSKGAIITDYEKQWKGGVRGLNVFVILQCLNLGTF